MDEEKNYSREINNREIDNTLPDGAVEDDLLDEVIGGRAVYNENLTMMDIDKLLANN